MVSAVKHKGSAAMTPFPPSSQPTTSRWSGESLAPSDGYSSLFTSGLLRAPPSPRLECSPDISTFPATPARRSLTKRSPSKLAPPFTPARRRRSSILQGSSASPQVIKSNADAVDRALDNVMKNLKLFAASPVKEQSRWSSSTEGSDDEWRPRKSGESVRSRLTIKSKKSARSLKSRKSEDTERMEVEETDVPPVPAPVTPSRGRRVVQGLVRRLGLTPKKKHGPPLNAPPAYPLPPLPEPIHERPLPRKSSLSTLRSIGKKASTGTLRSVRGHPFLANPNITDCDTPPLPFDVPGCVPTTPRRTPKTSIGHPKARPEVSPSLFLQMPRRAPGTPKNEGFSREVTPDFDMGEVITFNTPSLDCTTPDAFVAGTPSTGFPQTPSEATPSRSTDLHEYTPLTAKSAQIKKGNRLLQLLPHQQRANMGLPPKSNASTPALRGGLPARSRRDPLGILATNLVTTEPLPYRSGAGDGWGTPSLQSVVSADYFNRFSDDVGTFGRTPPLALRKHASPDFSAPREREGSDASVLGTLESGEEGWELERYLRDLEGEEVGVGQ